GDGATWKDLGYWFAHFPVSVFSFTVTVAVWTAAGSLLFMPAYYAFVPDPGVQMFDFGDDPNGGLIIDSLPQALAAPAVRLLFLVLALWTTRGLGRLHGLLARALLSPSSAARIRHLEETRAQAVDVAAAERRRIERDLHDGVQPRLVALAMDLGRARDRMETD